MTARREMEMAERRARTPWSTVLRMATSALGAPAVASRRSRTAGAAWPLYMPDELLLTFTGLDPLQDTADPRIGRLLERVNAIVGDGTLQAVPPRAAPAGAGRAAPGSQAEIAAEDGRESPRGDRDAPARADDGTGSPRAGRTSPLTVRYRLPKRLLPIPRRDRVKRAVGRIDRNLDALREGGVAVTSAMPNWLLSSSGVVHGGGGIGGPATIADPAPEGNWTIQVPAPAAWPPPGAGAHAAPVTPEGPIVVAVLDTSPGRAALERAAANAQYAGNALLQRLATDSTIVEWDTFAPPAGVPSGRSNSEADHGLFVSGIIATVAPHAEIHLLHILDERGAGRTDLLLEALDHCRALAESGRRVIVNLSMYLLIPPDDEIWAAWFGPRARYVVRDPGAKAALLERLDEEVERRIDLLVDAGALVVAAAGNDGRDGRAGRSPAPHQPRIPADYDSVLCVVAADRAGKLATYSNRADIPNTGNCVACYGGQGARIVDGTREIYVVPPGVDPREGVVGLWTWNAVPGVGMPKPNTTGWAYWSGTSFATPMISGIAANLLAAHELARRSDPSVPRLTPRALIERIVALGDPVADPDLGCPLIAITQTP